MDAHDTARWKCSWRLEKFHGGAVGHPYEVIEGEGNLLLNAGITALWTALVLAGTRFDAANARVCVGDSAAVAAAAQTDMQGVNLRKAVDAGYPQVLAQSAIFRATFTGAEANFAWNEFGIANAAAAGAMLNRKQTSFGTKAGGTWQLTVTISLA